MESQSEQMYKFIVQAIQLLKWKQVEDFFFFGCIKNSWYQNVNHEKTLKEFDLEIF